MLTGRMNAPSRICRDLLMFASLSRTSGGASSLYAPALIRAQLSNVLVPDQITKSGKKTRALKTQKRVSQPKRTDASTFRGGAPKANSTLLPSTSTQ
jgi:hypothetical protein